MVESRLYNYKLVFLSCSLVTIMMSSCNTGTESVNNCDFQPGNRNFAWQVDTVGWWPSEVGGVWAFSDDDAYVMGSIFQYDEEGEFIGYLGLHWDGIRWSPDEVPISEIKHNSVDVTGDSFYMVSVGFWDKSDEKVGLAEFNNQTKAWKGTQFERKGALRGVWTDQDGFFLAVGDSGMIYTKDGYDSEWLYSKAPSEFNLTDVDGVSRNEIYIRGFLSVPGEPNYNQLWKYDGKEWYKLYDNQDTTGIYLQLGDALDPLNSGVGDVDSYRCAATDSLYLYLISNESFLITSEGQSLSYSATNLSALGLPLRQNNRTGLGIDLFNPNDIWIYGTRFNFYHWDGLSFQRMNIPGIPNDDVQFGQQRKMIKTSNGKIFFPTEVNSQVYVVVQGVSN
ncbi:MAG: hypothetical protein ED557_08155 [Balneola sp.]|nr:MAG: hypothetical protein ED557_08155 [Balneola sp.]